MEQEMQTKNLVLVAQSMMPPRPYHNFGHAMDVYNSVEMYADLENVGGEEKRLLGTAAILHDIICETGATDNEERSADFAGLYLPTLAYSDNQIVLVEDLIKATKMPTNPQNLLEAILCDGDVDNLGRDDFLEKNEALRHEMDFDDLMGWYERSIQFLQQHRFYTASARRLRDRGKYHNIIRLQQLTEAPLPDRYFAWAQKVREAVFENARYAMKLVEQPENV